MQKLSVQEIQAVAEAAITARQAADTAKAALTANPDDESLKSAYNAAEQAALDAKAKVDALSQAPTMTPEEIAKARRRIAIINNDLRKAGVPVDNDNEPEDDDDDLGEDPNRVVTYADLQRIERNKASQSAKQMAETISDPLAKQAVIAALGDIKASGNPEKDFKNAVAIASQDKNLKVLEEIGRRPAPVQHRSGSGAPPRPEGQAFEPSAEEAMYMRPPFNLSKEKILEARTKAAPQS